MSSKKSSSNVTIGSILIILGLGIGLFAYAHRPPDGLVDAMNRGDSWAFKPNIYYVIMFIAALFGLAAF